MRPVYSGCATCGEGASGRATSNGVARDRPGLVRQGVGALTSELAARVEPKEVNGRGTPKQRQPRVSAVTLPPVSTSAAAPTELN